jgi:hypothetical protein
MKNRSQHARQGYERRQRQREARTPLELPAEMTPEGIAMQIELERRREAELKEALRKSRLRKHQLFAVTLQGGSVKS